jgi:hypothetical protein
VKRIYKLWEDKRSVKSQQTQRDTNILSTVQFSPSKKLIKIGLASESAAPIEDFLRSFECINNGFLLEPAPCKIEFYIEKIKNYEQARRDFKQPKKYDIIMVDNPWIPCFERDIWPLEDTYAFNSYLNNNPACARDDLFGKVFHENIRQVCMGRDNKILVFPIIGNVQMLIRRCDAEEALISETAKSTLLSENRLILQEFAGVEDSRRLLGYRGDFENGNVEVFLEILRMLGGKDEVDNSKLIINNHETACQALVWLAKLKNFGAYEKLTDELFASEPKIVAAFGWPSWDSEPKENLPGFNKILLQRISSEPIMGVWSLALPLEPYDLDVRQHAAQIIIMLSANQGSQSILARLGNVPVLAELDSKPDNYFWKKNYEEIRDALMVARPRPRTIHWNEIESELAKQIKNNLINYREDRQIEFNDVANKLEFAGRSFN